MKYTPAEIRAANEQRAAFLRDSPRCMAWGCHKRPTSIHEIPSGPARKDAIHEPCCYLALCLFYHEQAHKQRNIARELAWKALADLANYSRLRVNELRGRAPDAVSESDVLAEIANLLNQETYGIKSFGDFP